MAYDTAMNVIEFSSFEPNPALAGPGEPEELRRFTVLLDCGPALAGACHVRKVMNTEGETFALKTFRALGESNPEHAAVLASTKSFFEEYRNQLVVSCVGGFSKAFGLGYIGSTPAILMEWIEGTSLRDALPALADPIQGDRVPAHTVAAIGKGLGEILLTTQKLDRPFAHRDISLRNVLIRTERRPIAQQVAQNNFDLCFVDLGSSSYLRDDPSFTMRNGIWRKGTPEFAPPEMLTDDIPELASLRTSPSIDTYELASVLYTLYAGHTPYRLSEHIAQSPYLYKVEHEPEPLEPRAPEDRELVDAIVGGIHNEQSLREPLSSLTGRLDAWLQGIDFEPRTPLPISIDAKPSPGAGRTSEAAPKRPMVSRRAALILGGVCVAAAASTAALTGCWGLIDLSRGAKSALNDYTWEELSRISKKIQAAPTDEEALGIAGTYHLVNAAGSLEDEAIKSFTLSDGTKAEAQIVGFRTDTLSETGKPAGITFMFRTSLGMRNMNERAATGGWEQTDLRGWLASAGLAMLPDELARCIAPVRKLANNTGATTDPASITATDDALWLPSMSELCGYQKPETFSEGFEYLSELYSNEGDQYQLYREQNVSGLTANDALIRTVDDKRICYWERTPCADSSRDAGSTMFNRVGSNGDAFSFAVPGNKPRQDTYVIPGFCI